MEKKLTARSSRLIASRARHTNYEVDISGEDTPIVMAHISNVFASTESAL